jgi:predicted nucleic acid-binding protein
MLVDTSVWVDHFRRRNASLAARLEASQVWTHEFVVGELACGNLSRRGEILSSLATLPHAPLADHDEVLRLVSDRHLMGKGLGWIDMHLLAAAVNADLAFWTLDKRLAVVAADLGLAPAS